MTIQILTIALSAAAALIGGLVLANLRTISQQIASQNTRINKVEDDIKAVEKESARKAAECKDHCYQNFPSKVDFIREMSRQNANSDDTVKKLSELIGNVKTMTTVIENMPKICGSIAREIVKEMRTQEAGKNG